MHSNIMYRLVKFANDLFAFIWHILTYILLWFAPIKNFVHLVLILIFIDLVTGSYASIKRGDKFEARKLRHTIEKFIFYAVAIIAAYILQQILNDGIQLPRLVALYCGLTELKSIYENISSITKTDIVAILWDVVSAKFKELAEKYKDAPK